MTLRTPIRRAILLTLLIGVIFTAALPTLAATKTTAAITNTAFNPASCALSITWTVDTAGSYDLVIYDDGVEVFLYTHTFTGGESVSTTLKVGTYGTLNPGIGIIVIGQSGLLAYVDPYDYDPTGCSDGSWEQLTATDANNCALGFPSGSVIYTVPVGAPAFYEASLDTPLNFNLPAGTWYITEFSEGFAHVWVTCGANLVWIPADAVQQ